jgi:hypothetical protein
VYGENVKKETHKYQTLGIYQCYNLSGQRNYKDSDLVTETAVLLRRVCDLLVVLYPDSHLTNAKRLQVGNILEAVYGKLVESCIHSEVLSESMQSSLEFIKTALMWELEDLLYLVWYVNNHEDKGKEVLHIIQSFRLEANQNIKQQLTVRDLLHKDFVDVAVSSLKRGCQNESSKTVEKVLQEMGQCTNIQSKNEYVYAAPLENQQDMDKKELIYQTYQMIYYRYCRDMPSSEN